MHWTFMLPYFHQSPNRTPGSYVGAPREDGARATDPSSMDKTVSVMMVLVAGLDILRHGMGVRAIYSVGSFVSYGVEKPRGKGSPWSGPSVEAILLWRALSVPHQTLRAV